MSKTKNFLQFLDHLIRHQKFCVNEAAETFGVSAKTIQRYKKEIEDFFGVKFLDVQRGCYSLPNTSKIKELLIDPKDVEAMTHLMEVLVLLEGQKVENLNIDKELLKTLPQ